MNRTMLAAACVLAAAALAGCASDDGDSASSSDSTTTTETTTDTTTTDTTTTTDAETPTVVRITVVDGQPTGGIVRQTVKRDDRVVLVVTSDVADEIHLHGYDVSRDVAAGGTVRLPFQATIPGRFEAELENRGVQIADITVEP